MRTQKSIVQAYSNRTVSTGGILSILGGNHSSLLPLKKDLTGILQCSDKVTKWRNATCHQVCVFGCASRSWHQPHLPLQRSDASTCLHITFQVDGDVLKHVQTQR